MSFNTPCNFFCGAYLPVHHVKNLTCGICENLVHFGGLVEWAKEG